MQKTDIPNDIFIDPVCWMKVPSGRTNPMASYLMRTYYFCSEGCRKAFEADPNRYLEPKSPWRKGWLKRYLNRF